MRIKGYKIFLVVILPSVVRNNFPTEHSSLWLCLTHIPGTCALGEPRKYKFIQSARYIADCSSDFRQVYLHLQFFLRFSPFEGCD